ncbi:VasL domain-containing protein [Enterobacter chengduensis]|uniref:VasL domain-containing protein n=1 Tax=Enterobacter chengduensis TaxID=2494701 RepID=UPI0020057F0B|nr:VasL domain-containing protein [Enterobacter chengduensis]MCK7428749.1 type VI secretion system ImpA family N-terminal domain-containing protein [Enterobacter chengduensis]
MEHLDYQPVATGKDPRAFDAFEVIRSEINKLNHPLHPVIDWNLLQSQAIKLFSSNGVDLQSVVYYSMARTRLNQWNGFAEGCELLAVLIVSQWEIVWPPINPCRARQEILDWFAARVGSTIRQLPKNKQSLRDIYRAEYALSKICEKLNTIGNINFTLLQSVHFYLEQTIHAIQPPDESTTNNNGSTVTLPLVYLPENKESISSSAENRAQSGRQQQVFTDTSSLNTVAGKRPQVKGRGGVIMAGIVTGALLTLLGTFVLSCFQQRSVVDDMLVSTQPLPALVTTATAENHLTELTASRPLILEKYRQKLETILAQSPVESMRAGFEMVSLLEDIYPGNTVTRAWYKQVEQLSSQGTVPGYEQAKEKLQLLMDELLNNERQHRTVTISYLKSAIYDIQRCLSETEPLSYQLTSIEQSLRKGQQPSRADLQKVDDQLKGIQARYLQALQTLKSTHTPDSYQDEKK